MRKRKPKHQQKDSLQLLLEEALAQPKPKQTRPSPWVSGQTVLLISSETEIRIGVFQELTHRSLRARRLIRIPDVSAPLVADRVEFIRGDWWKSHDVLRPYSSDEIFQMRQRVEELLNIVVEKPSGP